MGSVTLNHGIGDNSGLAPDLLTALAEILDDRLSTAGAVREHHGKGPTFHAGHPPDAVAFARSTAEVAELVKLCAHYDTPVIAYGTGTALEGHTAALRGGLCIDLSRMDEVIEVNREDLDCRVQAGVTREALNSYLRDSGLIPAPTRRWAA